MDKSLMGTFVLALLMGLVLGVLSGCIRCLFFVWRHPIDIARYIGILQWVGVAVNPFLMFTVFYLHGRKLDLKAKLRSVIVLLFLGLYVGYFLGNMIPYLVLTPKATLFYILFYGLYPLTIICPFFVALSASAIAYIRGFRRENKNENV